MDGLERKIHIGIEQTDIFNSLMSIICHPNAEEFARFLTVMMSENSTGVECYYKILSGGTLPKAIPVGSMCHVKISALTHWANAEALLQSDLHVGEGYTVCVVKRFRGFHEALSQYGVEFTNIDRNGNRVKEIALVKHSELEVIKEF